MAIQGTQVPMYTKHTLFLYFSNFSILFIYFYIKNKINKTENKLNKTKHKTRLTKKKHTHTSNATNKNKKIEESDKIT